MNVLNVEFKARCGEHEPIKEVLHKLNARYVGEDHQIDTYFNVEKGRLKLREGTIERNLIYYERANQAGPKASHVQLVSVPEAQNTDLKALLTASLGIKVVVDKLRHIYFVDNIKIHLDTVQELGSFVEVEAIDQNGTLGQEYLKNQCDDLFKRFALTTASLASRSYSDMLLDG